MNTLDKTPYVTGLKLPIFTSNAYSRSALNQPKARWPESMRISTLAEYMDMSEASLRKLIKKGDFPSPTIAPTPRTSRWSKSSIDDFIRNKNDNQKPKGMTMSAAIQRSQNSKMWGR